jgi:broad specificity phosphatase PhoE
MAGFLEEIDHLLYRADVLAFSHFGALRGLLAILENKTDAEMMHIDVQNGEAFLFVREFNQDGRPKFLRQTLSEHVYTTLSVERIKVPAKFEETAAIGRTRFSNAARDRRSDGKV